MQLESASIEILLLPPPPNVEMVMLSAANVLNAAHDIVKVM